jgi:hypothetical protein
MFIIEAGKELLVGWVNQLNTLVYTLLNIIAKGKGIVAVLLGMNRAVFVVVTM